MKRGKNYLVTCYFSGQGATYKVTIHPNQTIAVALDTKY
jgi:hypothetical protein